MVGGKISLGQPCGRRRHEYEVCVRCFAIRIDSGSSSLGGRGRGARPAAADTTSANSLNDSVRELREQIREPAGRRYRDPPESQRYRTETTELRRELESMRSASSGTGQPAAAEKNSYQSAIGGDKLKPRESTMQHAATRRGVPITSGKVVSSIRPGRECPSTACVCQELFC
jgi:hypothetical protein